MEQWNQTRLLTSDHNLNQNMFLININNSSVKASDIQLTLYYIIRLDPSVCILLSDQQTGNTYITLFVLTFLMTLFGAKEV